MTYDNDYDSCCKFPLLVFKFDFEIYILPRIKCHALSYSILVSGYTAVFVCVLVGL